MIQRIQSIYLLLAALCSAAVYVFPFASVAQSQADSSLFSDMYYNVFDNSSLIGLFGGVVLLGIAAIFLFNNRKLQGKVTLFGAMLTLCALAFVFMTLTADTWAKANLNSLQAQIGAFSPILSIIFYLLAKRRISKDEQLVKSMDRLR
jgi:hypothetical protein